MNYLVMVTATFLAITMHFAADSVIYLIVEHCPTPTLFEENFTILRLPGFWAEIQISGRRIETWDIFVISVGSKDL